MATKATTRIFDAARPYIEKRIEVAPETGCWLWTNSVGSHGYGNAYHQKKFYLAHRLSHLVFKGDIPEGYQIDHLCKNPRCVCPDHLEAVPQALNIRRQFGGVEDLTKCPRGHDREHSYKDNQGKTVCRLCVKEGQARRKQKPPYGNQEK